MYVRVSFVFALALGASGAAVAQEEGEEGAPVARPSADVSVIGFEDSSSSNCNPILARYGRCVELVDFTDMGPAWDADVEGTDRQLGIWKNTSILYAQFWEDLAYRWNSGGDPLEGTARAMGLSSLGSNLDTWQATSRKQVGEEVFALPRAELWLGENAWIGDIERGGEAPLFPLVRYGHDKGLVNPADAVVMKGRFATRLAFNGHLHPFEIMDADPLSSGPFFEQMYPYRRAQSAEENGLGESIVPLSLFKVGPELKSPGLGEELSALRRTEFSQTMLTPGAGIDLFDDRAEQEFEYFYRTVGTQLLRFAREEFTPTHLRVLTALMAMETPPDLAMGGRKSGDEINAASIGQTDDQTGVEASYDRYMLDQEFALVFRDLPEELVDKYFELFFEEMNASSEFKDDLRLELEINAVELVATPPLQDIVSLAPDDIIDWVRDNANAGRTNLLEKAVYRKAVEKYVERIEDPSEKDQLLTEILLDHVNLAVTSQFDSSEGARVAPADLEDAAAGQWAEVLNIHGLQPVQMGDLPGAVDPIAVCSTLDRRDALTEPIFGAVNVDMLVVAPDGLTSTQDIIWAARDQMPFIGMDDPKRTKPKAEWIVGLPDRMAIYRVRWRVWTGWHLVWDAEPIGEFDSEERRLAARTTAICDDMVITTPELAPTLVRAAMLDGEFRPTEPIRKERKDRGNPDLGDTGRATKFAEKATEAPNVGQSTVNDAVSVSQEMSTNAVTGTASAISASSDAVENFELDKLFKKKPPEIPAISNDNVLYLREIVEAKLRIKADEHPLFVLMFDSTRPVWRETVWEGNPRTPYAVQQSGIGDRAHIRTSSWAYWMHPTADEETARQMISPAYLPTDLVNSRSLVQRWRRRSKTDFTFGMSVGGFPFRVVRESCNSDADSGSGVVCGTNEEVSRHAEGLALSANALATIWVLDDRRMAVEFGPEISLDMVFGPSLFWKSDDEVPYSFSYRFQAGVVAGVRFAPNPSGLHRKGRRYPWAAPRPDGSSALNRVEWGVRGGFLLGPTFNGLEGTAVFDLWAGWSMRRKEGRQASFTPFHPATWIGPYVRAEGGFLLSERSFDGQGGGETPPQYTLKYSITTVIGLRIQLRVKQNPEMAAP